MAQAVTQVGASQTRVGVRMAVVAQYALRSAPAVMMPELSNAFGITPLGVAAIFKPRFHHFFTELASQFWQHCCS